MSTAAIPDWSRDGRAMAGGVSGYPTMARSLGGQKRNGETPTGGWYMFYGKFSVKHMGPQAARAVLQLHSALDLLHHGPVRKSVQILQRRLAVHWVLLLGPV